MPLCISGGLRRQLLGGRSQYGQIAWVFACALGFISESLGRFETTEGQYFDIVGSDRRSVHFVEELGERVVLEAERYLGDQPDSFPQRILVTLRPGDESPGAEEYRIFSEPGGFVRIDFNWREELAYYDLCRGMVDAYLFRYAIYHYGYEAPEKSKAWVISALSHQTYLSLRPAVYQAWQESASNEGVPNFPSLVETIADKRLSGANRSNFFFFLAMRNSGLSRESVRSLCRAGIAGVDVRDYLIQLIQPSDPNQEAVILSEWWQEQMTDLLSESVTNFDSLEASEQRIVVLSEMDEFVKLGIEVKNLRELWRFRDDERVRELVLIRMGTIVVSMARVNPAYLNAQQSLGVLYERLLEGEVEHAYIFALSSFLGDFANAQRLREEIELALSEERINE
ncbi:MAG: hypothetical protein ACON39_07755 [Coraliomargaritaceae bacterium]